MKWDHISAETLDQFVQNFEGPRTFLQQSKNGIFREKLGEKTFRFGVFEGENLIAACQCQKISARRGTFLHIPHGPLISSPPVGGELEGGLKFFLQKIKSFAREQKCDFVRVSPLFSSSPFLKGGPRGISSPPVGETLHVFRSEKFRPAPLHINPDRTWILDLKPEEETLLQQMKKSTRYEVRRGVKKGIEVQMGNATKDLDIFWNLHTETAARQKFTPFSRKSTELELEVFKEDCQIFSAKIEGKFYASSVILFDDHAGYYHQGASKYHKLPAAHATLWAAIREAKRRGCTEFNFWGVSPEENKSHPWTGLSRFKRGFGGTEQTFLSAQDCPLTQKYWLNYAVETWRKWKRHY